MRPKLKGDVYWIPVPDGVFVLSSQASRSIKGQQIAQWLDRLAPYLDGSNTVDDLVADLSADKQQMVRTLIAFLARNGYVKDATKDEPHSLSADEQRVYEPEISYIDYFADSAAHRFKRYRESSIVVIGSGLTLAALVRALLQAGLRRVHVMTTGECPADMTLLIEDIRLTCDRDPSQEIIHHVLAGGEDAVPADALDDADMVVHVSDRPMIGRALALARLCGQRRRVSLQGVVVDGCAWLGPVASPGGEPGWEDAWRRLQANLPGEGEGESSTYAFADAPGSAPGPFLAGPTAAIVGNHLGFTCFKHIAGVGTGTEHLTRIDLETLRTTTHRFAAHPLARPAGPEDDLEFLARMCALKDGAPVDGDTFSQRAAECFDERLGLFTALAEGDLTQLPLSVAQVVVSNPVDLIDISSGHPYAVGVGDDFVSARRRATQRAFEIYASIMVDRRRLVPAEDMAAPNSAAHQTLWGFDLLDAKPRRIDAGLAFPCMTRAAAPYTRPVGLTSGFDWAQSVTRGLLDQCAALTAAESRRCHAPFAAVDLSTLPLEEKGLRYQRILDSVGVPVSVYDITGSLGVPTYAFCVGTETIAYMAGVGCASAITEGLELVLLSYQAKANMQPQYAPPPVADLPLSLHGSASAQRGPASPQDQDLQWPSLAEALASSGYRPMIVPLDHDPAVCQILPYIFQLVIDDA
jgi:putative thiazole-containing bacteriocin maturation protein